MRIFIRHGEKTYIHGKSTTFKHDPPLTEKGKKDAIYIGNYLSQLYGTPLFIVCSPFLRTRETAHYMSSMLPDKVPIYCDAIVSEFLGNQKYKVDVRDETKKFIPNVDTELFYNFKKRIESHNDMYDSFDYIDVPIWIITHGMVMNQIHFSYNGYKLRKKFPYLSYMIKSSSKLLIHS